LAAVSQDVVVLWPLWQVQVQTQFESISLRHPVRQFWYLPEIGGKMRLELSRREFEGQIHTTPTFSLSLIPALATQGMDTD
jgi:hypothetical protein